MRQRQRGPPEAGGQRVGHGSHRVLRRARIGLHGRVFPGRRFGGGQVWGPQHYLGDYMWGKDLAEFPAFQAAAHCGDGEWTCEFVVPFKTLKTGAPKAGDSWRVNLVRGASSWSRPPIGNWHLTANTTSSPSRRPSRRPITSEDLMSKRIIGICVAAVCLSAAARTEAMRLDSSKWTVTDVVTGKNVTEVTDNDPETLVTLQGDESAASPPGLVVDLGQTCVLHRVYLTGRRHKPEIWKSYENREKPPRTGRRLCRRYAAHQDPGGRIRSCRTTAETPEPFANEPRFRPLAGRYLRLDLDRCRPGEKTAGRAGTSDLSRGLSVPLGTWPRLKSTVLPAPMRAISSTPWSCPKTPPLRSLWPQMSSVIISESFPADPIR